MHIHRQALYFTVPLYGIPISEYTIPIVGQALTVQIAVPQIAITPHANAITWLVSTLETLINAGIKLEQTTTADTELEQKLVATHAQINPIKIATVLGKLLTNGLKIFLRHTEIPYTSLPIAPA